MASSPIVWLEIPVADVRRAGKFYESVFSLKLDYRILFDTAQALFSADVLGVKGCLVQVPDYKGSSGIKPIIYVNIISETLEKVERFGGTVALGRTLLRQKNKDGQVIIGTNLIDGQIGYYAEIVDTEGNHLYLYSHS